MSTSSLASRLSLVKIMQKGAGLRRLRPAPRRLIDGEAVETASPTGAYQVLLAATAGRMGRVPGSVAAAGAIEVTELRGTVAAAGPVLAGMVGGVAVSASVGLRAGEDIVLVGLISKTFDRFVLFGKD